ncbi:PLP-dependent aminotransferase family protein [Chloroflexota bacterium]
METPWVARYAQRTQKMSSSAVREILKFTQLPDVISFAGGLPAPEVFPIDQFLEASKKVLTESGPIALQYGLTEGYTPLREMICRHTKRYGLHIEPENVILTNGSQQALDLLGKIFINPGDKLLVEAPTYLGAIQAWNAYGADYIQVETDENGIIPEAMEAALRSGPKFAYILPNFQNPTGKTIPKDRRQQILELADHYGTPLIEDDPYGQLRYIGEHIEPVVVMDGHFRNNTDSSYKGNVIYLSTFSKTLAPGIRLAWVIAPQEVIHKLVFAKQGADLHTSTLVQMMAYEIAKGNFLDEHIHVIREIYGRRRNLMIETIAEYFPSEATWTEPEGGLFLWATLPESIDTTKMLKKAVDRKVAYVPGTPFFPNSGGENTMRLNFSNATDDNIVEGMKRLGEVIKNELT